MDGNQQLGTEKEQRKQQQPIMQSKSKKEQSSSYSSATARPQRIIEQIISLVSRRRAEKSFLEQPRWQQRATRDSRGVKI